MAQMSSPPARDQTALETLRASRVGIWTTALDAVSSPEAGEYAAELERLGYGSLWFGEAYGREAFTNASVLLGASEGLVVATGIANSYGKPVSTMRDYLEALDAAPFFAAGSETAPPRVLAALRPKMLELSATLADGAHPYLVTPEHTRRAREILGPEPILCVEQAVALTTDRAKFLRRAHWHLEIYTGLPNYRGSWETQGFGVTDFVRGGSERLKEAMVTWGDADTIAARVREHHEAGADHVMIQALGADAFEVPADQWRALAPVLTNRKAMPP